MQLNALLQSLELRHSDERTGHFCLFNCLVICHSKHPGLQRVYCDPFPKKLFHGSNRQDLVFIRPPGIENGGFVLKPDSVWYCQATLGTISEKPPFWFPFFVIQKVQNKLRRKETNSHELSVPEPDSH